MHSSPAPTKPTMNEMTQINSELLAADARGRKHIPVAVFAVILIHVVLFVVLLVAAGCRATTRANATMPGAENETFTKETATAPPQAEQNAPASPPPVVLTASEPVMATEPVVEPDSEPAPGRTAEHIMVRPQPPTVVKTAPRPAVKKASTTPSTGFYVVQSGDTVGGIAKRHGTTIQAIKTANNLKNNLIHPGQKLRLQPASSNEGSPIVKSSKPKLSKEV